MDAVGLLDQTQLVLRPPHQPAPVYFFGQSHDAPVPLSRLMRPTAPQQPLLRRYRSGPPTADAPSGSQSVCRSVDVRWAL